MSEELKEALNRIIESGYQLSADGFEYLETLECGSLKEYIKRAIQVANSSTSDIVILDRDLLKTVFEESNKKPKTPRFLTGKLVGRPLASEHVGQIQVLDDHPSESSGDFEGFVEHFRSRFSKIRDIFQQRIDMRDLVTIGDAFKMPLKSKLKIIGIVTTKRASGPRLFIEIEDQEDSITVMASDEQMVRTGLSILEDQVICVDAIKYKQDLLIAKQFIWPDIPSHTPRRSEASLCAAFLADVHIGSVLFQKKLFQKFISLVNLKEGSLKWRRLAACIKYIIIAGDLVDGVGVYPNHLNELEIRDIRKQYEMAAIMLSELPDYVEVIILPGNHDAVRKSLPQPPISKRYAERLYDDERIHLLGNPSRLLLDGVEVYISHGKVLDDILAHTPGMNFHTPLNGMELLLRCRHVAPTYGTSTPIAPEKEDTLVIESTPDIFQMGHIHVYDSRKYKGTTLISSSSWQDQTSYQIRMNLKPTVGIAPIFNLKNHQLVPLDIKRLN